MGAGLSLTSPAGADHVNSATGTNRSRATSVNRPPSTILSFLRTPRRNDRRGSSPSADSGSTDAKEQALNKDLGAREEASDDRLDQEEPPALVTRFSLIKADGLLGGVGDEGGFAPNLPANEAGLGYMVRAIEGAGYSTEEIGIALDVASTEFYKDDAYHMDGKAISGEELSDIYAGWVDEYPLLSIEDGFAEDDWRSWSHCMRDIGDRVQLVGDDLFVTQTERLSMGIESKAANAILVKVNQVGTVTETLETMDLASAHGMNSVVSHRSGETEDTTIADLAVGTRAGQIKTGAPARSDRVAKYNQLLRISNEVSEYRSPF